MMQIRWMSLGTLTLALCVGLSASDAQGRGQGQGGDKPKENRGRADKPAEPAASRSGEAAKPQNRDEGRAARANRERERSAESRRDAARSATAPHPSDVAIERASNRARFKRHLNLSDVRPGIRRFVVGNRAAERVAGGAIAHAHARKVDDNAFVITPSGRDVLIRNRSGDLLVMLDDDRARKLGAWRVVSLDDRAREGSPSFCRSGAGHPVWGRQWCVDKGFGIGVDRDLRWGRALDLRDVAFRREPTSERLTREVLASLLGDVTVDRLALHAITLGLVDPLVGTWRTDPAGPRVLLVNSGDHPVAEIVDVDRDRRGDVMLVALRPW